ncbi:hypothetical protein EON73_01170 [bacterium]|nr:MAG: hypothetical protein EON73_01170 [bacterium]
MSLRNPRFKRINFYDSQHIDIFDYQSSLYRSRTEQQSSGMVHPRNKRVTIDRAGHGSDLVE